MDDGIEDTTTQSLLLGVDEVIIEHNKDDVGYMIKD